MQVIFDLEAESPGMKTGEFVVYKARRSGKSMYYMADSTFRFKKLTEASVDGTMWYTVGCSVDAANWIRKQPREFWYEHSNQNLYIALISFDVHEKLYCMLSLRWT